MEEEDLLGVFDKECHISYSQEDTLSHSHFARQHAFPPPSPAADDWPEFSSEDLSPVHNNVGITICSAPETPESPHQDDDDDDATSTTPQPEDFKTPPEVPVPTSASSDDVVTIAVTDAGEGETSQELGFTEETENPNMKRRIEESWENSPAPKKLKDSDGAGFREEGTVVLGSDGNGGNTEVMNDDEDSDTETTTSSSSKVHPAFVGCEEIETENEKLEVRAEMNKNGKLKLKLNLEANMNSKEGRINLMNSLRNVARINVEEKKDVHCDVLETAKQRGLVFPRSRWYHN